MKMKGKTENEKVNDIQNEIIGKRNDYQEKKMLNFQPTVVGGGNSDDNCDVVRGKESGFDQL